MHSIRFKAIAITIAAVLTAVVCVFATSLLVIRSEIDQRSAEMMGLIANDARKSIEKYTDSVQQSVEMSSHLAVDMLDAVALAQGKVIGNDASKSGRTPEQTEQLDAYLATYASQIQSEVATVASHTSGAITYFYCISPSISTTEHGFFYSRVGRTGFGRQEPRDARKLDPSDRDHDIWYFTPIKRGRPSWVGPYASRYLNDTPVLSYVVPVYKSGTLIGVLGMDIPMSEFASLVGSIHVYDTGFACLLNEDGQILYNPEAGPSGMLRLPIDKQTLQQDDNGDALIRYTYEGEEYRIAFTTLATGMKLVIVAPTNEVYASSTRLTHLIPPLAVAIVILFSCLTLVAMRHVTSPLQRLTAASSKLADVNYEVELDYEGQDEVGALTVAFRRMRDRLQFYIEDLNRRARTDDLTGLPNQRHFFELAEAERQRLVSEGQCPIVLYFNFVGMRQFNRQYGFDEGDRLIRKMSRILARRFGEQRVSRFGQDHFVVISDESHLEERLYEVFGECQAAYEGAAPPVSVGIYQFSMDDVDMSVACDRAKYACDRRRGSYFSGFRYFDADMLKQAEMFRYIVSHLDQAISERWIQVYYQPIIRSVNGRVCDEEALSRWIDPVRGNLSPGEFITALEDSGLIYKLDLYVLDQVLEKIKIQMAAGLTIVPQSINLSRSDFEVLDIVEEIRSRVDAAGIPRDRITIEITESIIGSSFSYMKEQVERFQSLGFPVWMDDFGSGYSSLNLLHSIRFDLLKFDMSFLRRLDEGTSGKVILTELMQMATALGMDTLCEGVEKESHVRFLREIGCSKLQGCYFCKPIPYDEILKRYQTGAQIGFENPEESSYYEEIGKLNLHDLTAVAHESGNSLSNVFNTLPMSVMEITGETAAFVRTNQSYQDFVQRYFGFDLSSPPHDPSTNPTASEARFIQNVREHGDALTFFDDMLPDGHIVHYLVRRISANPVTGAVAVAIAVLSVDESAHDATYDQTHCNNQGKQLDSDSDSI